MNDKEIINEIAILRRKIQRLEALIYQRAETEKEAKIKRIIAFLSNHYNMPIDAILSRSRKKEIVMVRKLSIYFSALLHPDIEFSLIGDMHNVKRSNVSQIVTKLNDDSFIFDKELYEEAKEVYSFLKNNL